MDLKVEPPKSKKKKKKKNTMLSEETIQKVLAGNQLTMEDLTPEERKLFQRAVASGELSKLIAPWNPWWLKPSARTISFRHDGTQHVVPINNEQEMENSQEANAESPLSEIPCGPTTPLSRVDELIRSEPSPLISVHLIDILFSYCFTMRLYNGDWQSDALGSAITVLDISSVLSQDGKLETVAEALACCTEQVCSPTYRHTGGLQFAWALVDDVITLLSLGRAALVCALCDLQRLLQAGERELKSEAQRKVKKGEMSKLKLADRKVYFLTCWVNEQPAETWSALSAVVGVERASVAVLEPMKRVEKGEVKGKALIEEVQ
ncbi:hypothetical protein ACLOJK_005002 [Asimina triloba]